jgi:hypothetical protein
MAEFSELAQQVVEFVKPHVLAAAGKLVADGVSEARQHAGALFGWLKQKLTRPADAGALAGVEQDPTDQANWQDLADQLRKALERDEAFRQELLSRLLPDLPTSTTRQTAATVGDHNVTIQSTGNAANIRVNKPDK